MAVSRRNKRPTASRLGKYCRCASTKSFHISYLRRNYANGAAPMNQLSFAEQLKAHGNETDVRDRLARGILHGEQRGVAEEWLRSEAEKRSSAASARAEAREERMLSIAADALSIAKEDLSIARSCAAAARDEATWARWAAIIATIAAIISTREQISAMVISWLP